MLAKRKKKEVSENSKINDVNPLIKDVNLCGSESADIYSILNVSMMFPNIRRINLSHCKNLTNITPIIKCCPFITHLNIDETPIITYPIHCHQKYLQYLKELSFSGTGFLTADFLTWFNNCKDGLRSLKLRNKTYIYKGDDDFDGIDLCNHWQANHFDGDYTSVENEFFSLLVGRFSTLKNLDLYGCNTRRELLTILSLHTKLRRSLTSLELTMDEYASKNEIMTILSNSKTPFISLKSLSFSGKEYEDIKCNQSKIMTTFPSLERLCIKKYRNENGLKQVDIAKFLVCFPNIKELEVWCCSTVSFSLVSIIPQILSKVKSITLASKNNTLSYSQTIKDSYVHHHSSKTSISHIVPILSESQIQTLESNYPDVIFKLWNCSAKGFRSFHHINPVYPKIQTNTLNIDIKLDHDNKLCCDVIVDGISIWSNESDASLGQLIKTTQSLNKGGSLPIIKDWCCDCNIESFDGLLYYGNKDYIYWEICNPGPDYSFKFDRKEYIKEIFKASIVKKELIRALKIRNPT